MDKDAIASKIGYEGTGYETYIAKATCKNSFIPDNIKSMLNSEVIVYNMQGEQRISKINELNAVSISSPYWGYIQQWSQENLSEKEITQNLFEYSNVTLAGTLDIDPDFKAVMAHPKKLKQFDNYKISNDSILKKKVMDLVHKSKVYIKNDSLMKKDVKENGAYPFLAKNQLTNESVTMYRTQDNIYVYINLTFGGYCDYQNYDRYYSNISFVWDNKNKSFQLIDIFNKAPHYSFMPLFINSENSKFVGFIKKDFRSQYSYFKQKEWRNKESLEFSVHECD